MTLITLHHLPHSVPTRRHTCHHQSAHMDSPPSPKVTLLHGVLPSVGLDKCIRTCTPITVSHALSGFMALKAPCAPLAHLSLSDTLDPHGSFHDSIVLISLCTMWTKPHDVQTSQTGFSHLVTRILGSSCLSIAW